MENVLSVTGRYCGLMLNANNKSVQQLDLSFNFNFSHGQSDPVILVYYGWIPVLSR